MRFPVPTAALAALMVLAGGACPMPAMAKDKSGAVPLVTRTKSALPRGFVYLDKVAPDIIVEMRYATRKNFTGRRVPGYRANRCILARPVAEALARVQAAVRRDGYGLKVYDCYRPVTAVRAFMRWAEAGGSDKTYYHPRISRRRVIPLGYVARRSSHSNGTAIDLTLVRATGDKRASAGTKGGSEANSCIDAPSAPTPANIDMGTAWDCFDVKSHTYHGGISAKAKANRKRLLKAMQAEGFRNYRREWWHFSMSLGQFKRAYDFPVE